MNPSKDDTDEIDVMLGDPQYRLPDFDRGKEYDAIANAGEINWGHEKFGVEALRSVSSGKGFKIGAVDTGVDDAHQLLLGVKAKDFTGSSIGYRDRNGHGSHVSGTIFGKDSRIGVGPEFIGYHGKGLGDGGSGSMSALLNAIEWCLSEGCTVVSNSWGGGTSIDTTTARKFREWAELGIWLIFAGGNSGPNTGQTDAPGNSPDVINIAALDSNLRVATFSSAGALSLIHI
jgi:subtilisin